MKNNKGFAISTALYGLLVLFLMLIVFMLGIIYSYKHKIDKLIVDDKEGARAIINKKVKDLNKISFKVNDTDKYRCESKKVDYEVSITEEIISNEGYDYLILNECNNNCYFFTDDATCIKKNDNVYSCSALIYNECEKVSDNYKITEKYEGKLPYVMISEGD